MSSSGMSFCFVLSSAGIGGFRTFTQNLGRQLKDEGYEVTVLIVARGSGDLGDVDSMRRDLRVEVCHQSHVLLRSRFIGRIVRKIEEINPDVLILNHNAWAQAALPYLPTRIVRIPVVHSVTHTEVSLIAGNSKWWDAAVAVSPAVEQLLQERWPAERIRMIPVGVPCPSVHARAQFDDSPLRICYVGRLDQNQKNVLCIPQVAATLSDSGIQCLWTMIGDGPDRKAMENSVRDRGVRDLFTFTGVKCREDVERLTSQHHLLILPSIIEANPHVVQEAQMLGVVPIATRLSGATDFVIRDGHDGRLCDNYTAQEFAAAIAALDSDRNELARLSANAVASVRRRFAIAIVSAQYRTMLEAIRTSTLPRIGRRRTVVALRRVPSQLMPTRLQTALRMSLRVFRDW
jgi:glycosyltransferase involved in cell wall biosynthesis